MFEMIECIIRGRFFVRKSFSEGISGIMKIIEGKILFFNCVDLVIF